MRAQEKKYRVYVGFIDLEVYNREALWQVLRMSDVGVYKIDDEQGGFRARKGHVARSSH